MNTSLSSHPSTTNALNNKWMIDDHHIQDKTPLQQVVCLHEMDRLPVNRCQRCNLIWEVEEDHHPLERNQLPLTTRGIGIEMHRLRPVWIGISTMIDGHRIHPTCHP